MKRRGLFFAMLALGIILWRGAFGFLPIERTITWRLPVAAADVRRMEVQLWQDGELLKREDFAVKQGLFDEPTTRLPLSRGPHRALVLVWSDGGETPRTFERLFDPEDAPALVLP
jgi:hypothetical protein